MKKLTIGSLILLFFCSSILALNELPELGDSSASIISNRDEEKLGKVFMQKARQYMDIVDDIEINAYIQSLGDALVQYSDMADKKFTFFIVNHSSINAFAVPGGYIGIHTGLILASQSESELAAVIAHEISHITQHHMSRSIEATKKMSIPMAVALLAAALLSKGNSDFGQAALATIVAGSTQQQINYTRAHEQEADRLGIALLARSHFDPHAMSAFFSRLQKAAQYSAHGLPEILRTHPISTSRMAEARERATGYQHHQISNSISYYINHSKLRVLASKSKQNSIASFAASLKEKQYRNYSAEYYGYIYALFHAGKYQLAKEVFSNLPKKTTKLFDFQVILAKINSQLSLFDRAIQQWKKLIVTYPERIFLHLYYIDTLIAYKQYIIAYDYLKKQMLTQKNKHYYQRMATLSHHLKKTAQAHIYQAELYYAQGHLLSAIKQIQLALKAKNIPDLLIVKWRSRLIYLENEWTRAQHQKPVL